MEKKQYHHGDLKYDLIEKGLQIITEQGVKALTMRKVAALCEVSPTAAYKHFQNKEDLLNAIKAEISQNFANYLQSCLDGREGQDAMVEIGKGYVRYMVEHKDYYNFMFDSELSLSVSFENGEFQFVEDNPFSVFYESAEPFLATLMDDKKVRSSEILLMWSEVHGLAGLLCKGVLKTSESTDCLVEWMFAK